MAIRPVALYSQPTEETFGTIYFNSDTRSWYSDAECRNQISTVAVPRRSQYAFTGYRMLNSSTSTLFVDADGNIVYTPNWSTSTATQIYARWTQVSKRYVIDGQSTSTSYTWTPRTTEFFRSVTPSTQFYSDDQLTSPIIRIDLPYEAGKSCAGIYVATDTGGRNYYVNADGTFNASSSIATTTATTDWDLNDYVRMWTCYKITLNANGGTGGEQSPVWWDKVRSRWCGDDNMLQEKTTVAKPTYSGKIFKGYYSAGSGGTQVVDANGTLLTYSAVESSNKTVYAQWASPVAVTVNNGSASGGVSALYYGGGQFFTSSALTTPVTSVPVPTLANHRFDGYYSASSGGTQYIDASGNILSAFAPSGATTVYARFTRLSYTIAVNANGGVGLSALYANASKTAVYADETCSGAALTSVTPLTRAGYRFMGLFAANSVSGTKLVESSGAFLSAMSSFVAAMGDSATVYALWQQVFTIVIDQGGGSGAPGEIYYDDAYARFYDSPAMSSPVSSIATPTKECYAFAGLYTASSGGTQVVNSSGQISAAWTPTASTTVYARWTFRSYKYTLDPNGGTTTQGAIYNGGSAGTYYADDQLTTAAATVAIPTRPGYAFEGYYNGSTQIVSAAGAVTISSAMAANATATARWTANAYTLTFDPDGGTTPTNSKTVTFGQPIGELPIATRTRAQFTGWAIGMETISSATVWNWPQDERATAGWDLQFGNVVDYFNMRSYALLPIASDSGDNRQRICYAHTGKIDGAETSSGVWRNPRTTYVVKANTTVNVTLGKAFAGSSGTSGYMIVAATVDTRVGKFPTVTVEAVANEGADAVNKWSVAITVVARSKAQNLLNGVNGGGRLNACSVTACCDPVVIAENMMPCASDIVNGRIELAATTIATGSEGEPTAAGGFTSLGAPKVCTDAYYTTYNLTAQKEL